MIISKTTLARFKYLPHVLVLLLGIVWGLSISLIKIASEANIPFLLIMLVVSGCALVLQWSIAWWQKSLPRWNRESLIFYMVCSVTSILVPHLVELWVAKHITAAMLSLVITTTPIFTLVFAYFGQGAQPNGRSLFGIALGCAAVLILIVPGIFTGQAGAVIELNLYLLAALLVPAFYGGYHNYVDQHWPKTMTPIQAGSGEMAIGLIIIMSLLAGQLLWQGDVAWQAIAAVKQDQWGLIFAMGILSTSGAILYFTVQYLAGAVFTSQSNYVTTVAGVLWGVVIFAESLNVWIGLSIVALLVANRFIDTDNRRQESEPETLPASVARQIEQKDLTDLGEPSYSATD